MPQPPGKSSFPDAYLSPLKCTAARGILLFDALVSPKCMSANDYTTRSVTTQYGPLVAQAKDGKLLTPKSQCSSSISSPVKDSAHQKESTRLKSLQ